ncbi:type III-B CRISPR module-associated Cmr3 family protein [Actinoalloteichus caeruleus]|uniref:type III-B CRISPR module-associated Cmr3 family protein n=1 Tax=Actinoalloteichus cyanogriseus TaxID=2893586 RepID=UPI00138E38EA|nr:type III-B CRISPR module-associated Cmr3 family protein [Actinoalloteichus caeruleus]
MLEVMLTAEQPLSLGVGESVGNLTRTHRHVPGSVLRGALAAAWIAEHGEPAADPDLRNQLRDTFERGVRFSPLFAEGSSVVPLSVLRCSYLSQAACADVVVDTAWDEEGTDCPECDGPLRAGRGEVEFVGADDPVVHRTRVALNPDGTARDGALFTREALNHRDGGTPRRFLGTILTRDTETSWLSASRPLLLGGGRSTSGLVRYEATPGTAAPPTATGRRLVLRLVCPGVFVDAAGRPSDVPDLSVLRELLGVDVEITRHWVRRERLTGWHSAADLPKSEEHAVTAGSTYVLELSDDPDPTDLTRLLEHGVGLRRAEGLGWIELDRWQPPPVTAEDHADGSSRAKAAAFAAMLVRTGHGRRILKELRLYHFASHSDKAPSVDHILGRPVFHALDEHRRKLLDGLMRSKQSWIPEVVAALEIQLRGGNR